MKLKSNHSKWQQRVLRECKYLVVLENAKTSLHHTIGSAWAEIAKLPKYRTPKLYKNIADLNFFNAQDCILLEGLSHVSVVGNVESCQKNRRANNQMQTVFAALS